MKRQRNRERGKGDSWSQTACQKKEQSPATNATFLQVRQSDASGNSSFLSGLEEALLSHFLSLVSISLTALTTSPAEPRNEKETPLPLFSLPPSLPSCLFPQAKQQCAVFLEAGIESYAEQHQIWPAPSYHCNYAFHCPDTKDDRMCGIGNMFHYVSASFFALMVSEKDWSNRGMLG